MSLVHLASSLTTHDVAWHGRSSIRMMSNARHNDSIGLDKTHSWPTNPLRRLSLAVSGAAVRAACRVTEFGRDLLAESGASVGSSDPESAFARWLDQSGWPERELRVGIAPDTPGFAAIRDAQGTAEISWVPLESGRRPTEECERLRLDAVLWHECGGNILLSTLENSCHDASWYDWSCERPLSYLGVFPPAVDCSRIAFEERDIEADPQLARALIETACVLSRSPERLVIDDRVGGRKPIREASDEGTVAEQLRTTSMRRRVIESLREAVMRVGQERSRFHAIDRAAARAVGAWLMSTHAGVSDEERSRELAACAAINGDEPSTVLRFAVAQVAAGHDEEAWATFAGAFRMLRDFTIKPGSDPLLLVQAEIELGAGDPLMVGRVAAGIALVCARLDASKIRFLRDDLLDDATNSGWLIGRDQDRAFLVQLFRDFEREAGGIETPALFTTGTLWAEAFASANPWTALAVRAKEPVASKKSAKRRATAASKALNFPAKKAKAADSRASDTKSTRRPLRRAA